MRAVVVALGKIGLPLAAQMARAGHEVVGDGRLRAQADTTAAVAAGPDLVVAVPPLVVDERATPDWRILDRV
ncbi:MAG TPA: nucleotide sugar dehydrogenase, partial [Solirubrobacteraceae bacterium]